MNYILFFLILLSTPLAGMAVQIPPPSLAEEKHPLQKEDEAVTMAHLIEITEQQLQVQKQIKSLMIEFQKQQDAFANGNQTKAQASLMVRTARQIFESIMAHHLQHLFTQEYLDELVFFSSIAGKNKMSRP